MSELQRANQEWDAPQARPSSDQSLPTLMAELWELIKTYVRQETVDPVKGVGRFVTFGVAGAFLVGTGAVFLAVGALRLLQTETDTTFTGNWSWAPYGIVFIGLVVGGTLSLQAIGSRSRDTEGKPTGRPQRETDA